MKRIIRFTLYSLPVLLLLFVGCFFFFPILRELYNEQMERAMDQAYEAGRSIALPSPTSYPRLEENEAHARVVELLKTNGGCRFPCWWGIVPGKTHWQEAHALLSPLLLKSDVALYRGEHQKTFFIGEYYDLPGETSEILAVDIDTSDEFVHDILTYDILIRIFLYYPSQGVAAGYQYPADEFNETIRLCGLDQPSTADFYVWEANSFQDFETVATKALWHPKSFKILSLDLATEWTTDSFFAYLESRGASTACIETPVSLWEENSN